MPAYNSPMPPDHPPHRASVQKLFITGLLTLLPIWLTWVVIKFVFVLLSDISKPWVEPLSHRIAATFPQSLGWFNGLWVQNTIAMVATLFVIVADHGARIYGRADFPMRSYRIPLLILAPEKLAPGRIAARTSQMDIAPTVLALLGMEYEAPFYGRDALAARTLTDPVLLSHNHDVALYRGDELVVLGLNRSSATYHYDERKDEQRPAPPDPALRDLAIAYYQTAYDLFRKHRYQ